MCFYSNKNFDYGMFAVLKIYQYILLEQNTENYNMKLFKNCNLDTKFTSNKRCLLEYAVFYSNYDIVKILMEHNCNLIDNESFIYSIISYMNNETINTYNIFKLILTNLKKNPMIETNVITSVHISPER